MLRSVAIGLIVAGAVVLLAAAVVATLAGARVRDGGAAARSFLESEAVFLAGGASLLVLGARALRRGATRLPRLVAQARMARAMILVGVGMVATGAWMASVAQESYQAHACTPQACRPAGIDEPFTPSPAELTFFLVVGRGALPLGLGLVALGVIRAGAASRRRDDPAPR